MSEKKITKLKHRVITDRMRELYGFTIGDTVLAVDRTEHGDLVLFPVTIEEFAVSENGIVIFGDGTDEIAVEDIITLSSDNFNDFIQPRIRKMYTDYIEKRNTKGKDVEEW